MSVTLPERVRRFEGGRPTLLAIAVMNGITGIAAAAILAPLSFGADVDFLRRGAQGFLGHYPVHDFVFTPLAAVLAVPLAWLPAQGAAVVWSLVELSILLAGVVVATRGIDAIDRLLIGIAALGFVPVVNELLLGQVTLIIAAGIYPAVARDGRGRGVALGIVLALVPKPLVIPVLAWMLLRRRRALAEAIAVAASLSALALVIIGPEAYGWWLEALVGAGEVNRNGNVALTALPVWAWAIGVVLTVVVAGWTILKDEATGLVAALLAGLLLAPYTLLYALSILLLGVPAAFLASRRATSAWAIAANIALVVMPTVWMAVALGAIAAAVRQVPRSMRQVPRA